MLRMTNQQIVLLGLPRHTFWKEIIAIKHFLFNDLCFQLLEAA